ncbi:MAG: hypothetical protein WD069_22550 [Planctomycetales bacterium]
MSARFPYGDGAYVEDRATFERCLLCGAAGLVVGWILAGGIMSADLVSPWRIAVLCGPLGLLGGCDRIGLALYYGSLGVVAALSCEAGRHRWTAWWLAAHWLAVIGKVVYLVAVRPDLISGSSVEDVRNRLADWFAPYGILLVALHCYAFFCWRTGRHRFHRQRAAATGRSHGTRFD